MQKLPVLRLNFLRHSAREIVRLSTGIFRKYPPKHDIMYICMQCFYDKLTFILFIDLIFVNSLLFNYLAHLAKGQVIFGHHLASVVRRKRSHLNLLL